MSETKAFSHPDVSPAGTSESFLALTRPADDVSLEDRIRQEVRMETSREARELHEQIVEALFKKAQEYTADLIGKIQYENEWLPEARSQLKEVKTRWAELRSQDEQGKLDKEIRERKADEILNYIRELAKRLDPKKRTDRFSHLEKETEKEKLRYDGHLGKLNKVDSLEGRQDWQNHLDLSELNLTISTPRGSGHHYEQTREWREMSLETRRAMLVQSYAHKLEGYLYETIKRHADNKKRYQRLAFDIPFNRALVLEVMRSTNRPQDIKDALARIKDWVREVRTAGLSQFTQQEDRELIADKLESDPLAKRLMAYLIMYGRGQVMRQITGAEVVMREVWPSHQVEPGPTVEAADRLGNMITQKALQWFWELKAGSADPNYFRQTDEEQKCRYGWNFLPVENPVEFKPEEDAIAEVIKRSKGGRRRILPVQICARDDSRFMNASRAAEAAASGIEPGDLPSIIGTELERIWATEPSGALADTTSLYSRATVENLNTWFTGLHMHLQEAQKKIDQRIVDSPAAQHQNDVVEK